MVKASTLLGAALAYSVVSSAGTVRPRAGNPFDGRNQFINPGYANRVEAFAQDVREKEPDLARKAMQIKDNNPTWTWLDSGSKVAKVAEYLQIIQSSGKTNVIGTFVIYNLPGRSCGTTKPSSEFPNNADGDRRYKQFIDDIKTAVSRFPTIPVAFIIEPEAIENLILYKGNPECDTSGPVYRNLINYTITTLSFSNIVLYLDGGSGGTLAPDEMMRAAATQFPSVYKDAGGPANLRGLAVNVGKYNAWSVSGCPNPYARNTICDEKRYIKALSVSLDLLGWPDPHFIIDQSRSGVQPNVWANLKHSCNIMGTGFGLFPGAGTDDKLVDSFVWVKPGGESDGTSNKASPNYNPDCDASDSLKPSPEYSEWFEDYFRQLITNANPPIVPTPTREARI